MNFVSKGCLKVATIFTLMTSAILCVCVCVCVCVFVCVLRRIPPFEKAGNY
jgi:hypothetical protein